MFVILLANWMRLLLSYLDKLPLEKSSKNLPLYDLNMAYTLNQ